MTLALFTEHGFDVGAWPSDVRDRLELMSLTSTGAVSLWGTDPARYEPHMLHAPGRTYLETNCYVDVLIELLHAHGDEPLAMLGFIARTDWEGDQFTYAKPRQADMQRLFGVEIHEMLPYRTLPEHIEEQLSLGRTVLVEIDAWYLPDTAATSYRREHLKTTVAPETIDRGAERMRYFHNAGFYELDGEDYRGAFRMLPHFTDDVMDPFTEVVRFDADARLTGDELRDGVARAARAALPAAARAQPVHGLGERAAGRPATPARGRARGLPRVRVRDRSDGRLGVRAVRRSRRLGARARRRRRGGGDAPDRRGDEDDLVPARATPAFDPEPSIAVLAEAWDEGMAAIGHALS